MVLQRSLARVPPHDTDAEAAVLGALLLLGDSSDWRAEVSRALDLAAPEDFYVGSNIALRRLIGQMHQGDVPPTAIVIYQQADARGVLEAIGGRERITSLAALVTSPAHVEHYAAIVRSKAAQRRAEAELASDLDDLQAGRATADDVHERQRQRLARVVITADTKVLWSTGEAIVNSQETEAAFLVEGMVLPGCVTLLAAEAGAGKSTLAGGIVSACLQGGRIIGLGCQRVASVVWVTEESRHTFRHILGPCGLNSPALHIMGREQMESLTWPRIMAAVMAKVKSTGAGLVLLDTFASLAGLSGDDENLAGPVMGALRPVKALASTGPGVLLTHHFNKDTSRQGLGRYRGSSALVSEVDAAISLYRVGGEGCSERVLNTDKSRGPGWVAGWRYQLRVVVDAGRRRFDLQRLHQTGREGDLDAAVLRLVNATPGLSRAKIEAALEGKSDAKRTAIDRVATTGKIREEPGERGARCYFPAQPRPLPSGEVEVVGPGHPAPPPLRGGVGGEVAQVDRGPSSPHLAPAEGATTSTLPEAANGAVS